MSGMTATIAPARFPDDVEIVSGLFREYMDGLGIDLAFQAVDAELAGLPGKYGPPRGTVLLAREGAGHPVGCIALRPLGHPGACEMKRLYVRPEARGQNLGRRLAEAIIAEARGRGYSRMLLDTLAAMQAAQALYESLGFAETAAYYENPLPGTRYLALDLDRDRQAR
ncbi:MAG: GNAT family N-acetyltransferase [Bauldia sp.]